MYSKAIELNSQEFVYYGNRAAAAVKLERFADAVHDCEEALRLGTGATKAQKTKFYFRMATGLQGLNRIEDAQAAINSGLELDSKNGQLLQLNAELTSSAAPVEAAKPKKKKIVIEEVDSSKVEEAPAAPVVAAKPKKKKIVIEEVDSSKVEEAAAAPVAAAKPKKKKIAIEEVDSSKVQEEVSAVQYKKQGNAKYSAKDYSGANEEYSKGIALDAKCAPLYMNRAVVRLELNDAAGAQADCDLAMMIGVPEASQLKIFYRRALSFKMQSKYDSAEKDLLAALAIQQNNAECQKELEQIRKLMPGPSDLETGPSEEKPEVNESAVLDGHCCTASRELKQQATDKQRAGCFDEAAELLKQALALQYGQPGTSADEMVATHKQLAKCEKHLHTFR